MAVYFISLARKMSKPACLHPKVKLLLTLFVVLCEYAIMSFWDITLAETRHALILYLGFATAAFILFYGFLRHLLARRKIQLRFPKLTDYGREVFFSLISIIIFGTVSGIVFLVLRPYNNVYYGAWDSYGVAYYFLSYIWVLFVHDTYFYWAHRLLHTNWLYHNVHIIHHRSTNPSPWASYAFHPLEALMNSGILFILAFTVPIHYSVAIFVFAFQIGFNVYVHLGYELLPRRFQRTTFGRWLNTSVAHNLHHERSYGNFGLYLLFWDRVMGTVRKDYDTAYDNVIEGNSSKPRAQQ